MQSRVPVTRTTESVLDVSTTSTSTVSSTSTRESRPCCGKAPPVDSSTGEDQNSMLDDWLPFLQTAATWYNWSEDEKLMQLGGHLRGKARQEWDLLADEKRTYSQAIQALKGKLEPTNKTLIAQHFRRIRQGDQESMAELILRMERTFRVAYGKESMSQEVRSAFLHVQLQDALKNKIQSYAALVWLFVMKRSDCWSFVRDNSIGKPVTPRPVQHNIHLPHPVIRTVIHAYPMTVINQVIMPRVMLSGKTVELQIEEVREWSYSV